MRLSKRVLTIFGLIILSIATTYIAYRIYYLDSQTKRVSQSSFLLDIQEVRSNCKSASLTPQVINSTYSLFVGDLNSMEYMYALASALDNNIKYNTSNYSFDPPINHKIFIAAYSENLNDPPIDMRDKQTNLCWVMWMEDHSGQGKLAYLNKDNQVSVIKVTNFLYVLSPQASTNSTP